MKLLAGAVLVVMTLGCTGSTDDTTGTSAASTSVPSSRAPVHGAGELRLRIALPRRTLITGRSYDADLVVTNQTGAPLRLQTAQGCKPGFALGIGNNRVRQRAIFDLMCESGALDVPRGRTKYPVDLSTSYNVCRPAGPQGPAPACLPDGGMPPLPTGRYRVNFEDNGSCLPPPEPVPVRLVRSGV